MRDYKNEMDKLRNENNSNIPTQVVELNSYMEKLVYMFTDHVIRKEDCIELEIENMMKYDEEYVKLAYNCDSKEEAKDLIYEYWTFIA